MLKNRVSLSIILGFFAALLALHCDLAFSQTSSSTAGMTSVRPSVPRTAQFAVRTQVMASCRFMTGPIDSPETLRRWLQALADGQTAARCGASQPLTVAAALASAPVQGAYLSATADPLQASGGSPFDAQTGDGVLLISF